MPPITSYTRGRVLLGGSAVILKESPPTPINYGLAGTFGFRHKQNGMIVDFDEMLSLAQQGGDDVPETIYDDIRSNFRTTVEGSQAALANRDAAIQARDAEIQSLKALAFERMMNNENLADDDTDDSPAPPQQQGINSLFTFHTRK